MPVDPGMIDAAKRWCENRIPAGSCTMLLLAGYYDEAFLHAHPLIKPHWQDHIEAMKEFPLKDRIAAKFYVDDATYL